MRSFRVRVAARVCVAVTVLLALAGVSAAECAFPSKHTRCWSPDRRFVVEWLEANSQHDHQLFWRDGKTGRRTFLRAFSRHVGVQWSPTGDRLTVTDFSGSDTADALLWTRLDEPPRSFDDDLQRYLTADDQIWRNDHRYFTVVRWMGPAQVLIRASGHGESKQMFKSRFYLWNVNGRIGEQQHATNPGTPDEHATIDEAMRVLKNRSLEDGFGPDGLVNVPVTFHDGGNGALVAVGFSGPVRGYLILLSRQRGGLHVLDMKKTDVDWGVWSVFDQQSHVNAEMLRLVIEPRRGEEPILRISGAVHRGTLDDEEGHMALLRVSEGRIETLFEGAATDGFATAGDGVLAWNERKYEFVDVDGNGSQDIVETISDCEGERRGRFKCTPRGHRSVYRYDGSRFVVVQ
jgi:hypothetical protein